MILAKFTLVDVNVFSCYSKLNYFRCHIIIAADMQNKKTKPIWMSLALCLQPTDALLDLPYFQKGTKIRWYQRVEQTCLGVWSVTCPSVTSKGDS